MKLGTTAAAALAAVLVAGCGQKPLKPAATHIRAGEESRAEGSIPPPV